MYFDNLVGLVMEVVTMREAVERLWPEIQWIGDLQLREQVTQAFGAKMVFGELITIRLRIRLYRTT
jgi:hypothetical protein